MATHYIKILPQYFDAILDGTKKFEIRKNDRGYQKGDTCYLEEVAVDANNQLKHTGRVVKVMISYVTNFMQKEDMIVFGFLPLPPDEGMKNAPAISGTAPKSSPAGAAPAASAGGTPAPAAGERPDGENRNQPAPVGAG